jgi:signal transduction histidine kinase
MRDAPSAPSPDAPFEELQTPALRLDVVRGVVVLANRAAREALAPVEALAALGAGPADAAALDAALSALRRGEPAALRCALAAADGGRPRAVLMTAAPSPGDPPAALAFIVDESGRAELREDARRFHDIAAASGDVFWVAEGPRFDAPVYLSPAFERIWGRPFDALGSGRDAWFAAIHPEDRPAVVAALEPRAGADFAADYRILRPDGAVRWIEARGVVAADGARMVGVARDATLLRQTEFARVQRVVQQSCVAAVLEAATRWDAPVDAVLAEMAGLIARGLVAPDLAWARIEHDGHAYGAAADAPEAHAIREPLMVQGRRTGQITLAYGAAPADPTLLSLSPKVALDGGGPFLGGERDMLRLLARQVGRFLESRLSAEKMARAERLQALGQMTGGVAHDFNNLLTIVLSAAELLADRLGDDPESQELAETIAAAAERGAELTGRLLAFASRQALEPRAVDLATLVAGMEPLLRRTLSALVTLEIDVEPGLPQARVDPAQFEVALLNLVVNARDAMPEGGGLTIRLAATRLDAAEAVQDPEVEDDRFVMVSVGDTGPGMAPEVAARAFEPFFTTKPFGRGSGLGLSLVYGFARQSGGMAGIDTAPGRGTTVRLHLPCAEEARDADPVAAAMLRAAEAGRGERLLVVEDDPGVRAQVCAQLRDLGYGVESAGSGAEAMEALARLPDVVLLFTDVVMPGGMSGPDLAAAARAMRPGLKVLFTSGYARAAPEGSGAPLRPGDGLLTKPYRRRELARMVRRALDG